MTALVSPGRFFPDFRSFLHHEAPRRGYRLGLSIVYGIVHQHGGEVSVESAPGVGAKFTVELPVVRPPAEGVPARAPQLEAASPDMTAGRILVVEDEPTVGQLIADVLREDGHRVDVVMDSQEGLNQIARTNYDLVICDLRMPRLDGPAFYEALVRARNPAQHRIIFVTGDTLAPRTLEFLEPHGLPYLAKPFLVEELKLAVNRGLERARADPSFPPENPDAGGQPEAMRRRRPPSNGLCCWVLLTPPWLGNSSPKCCAPAKVINCLSRAAWRRFGRASNPFPRLLSCSMSPR
jgi:CheY-like chemotaxis protein